MKYSDVHKAIGKHMLADGMSPVIDLEKSHGSWLVMGVRVEKYLVFFFMFVFLFVVFNHPYVLENKDRFFAGELIKPKN